MLDGFGKLPKTGVVLHPASLRRTHVRLVPKDLHALVLNIYRTRPKIDF